MGMCLYSAPSPAIWASTAEESRGAQAVTRWPAAIRLRIRGPRKVRTTSPELPSTTTCADSASAASLLSVSYTHLRAHETKANLVCRLLLAKKKLQQQNKPPGDGRDSRNRFDATTRPTE